MLVAALAPQTASAQDDGINLEQVFRRGDTKPKKGTKRSDWAVEPPTFDEIQLDILWTQRRAATGEEREELTSRFLRERDVLGQGEDADLANVLLVEAINAHGLGQEALYRTRIDQVARVAPSAPYRHFAQASATMSSSPASVLDIYGHFADGYKAGWHWAPSRFDYVVSGIHTLYATLALVLVFIAVVGLLRHLRLAAADLTRLLPRGVSSSQLMVAIFIGVLAPGALFAAPILSVLAAVVVVGAHLSWIERGLAVVALGALALIPISAEQVQVAYDFPSSPEATIWQDNFRQCDALCREELSNAAPDKNTDHRLLENRRLRLAVADLKTNDDYAGAVDVWSELAKKGTTTPGVEQVIQNNLGVAQAMNGEYDKATKTLEKANALAPQDWRVMVNLYRAYDLVPDAQTADYWLQEAIKRGGDDAARATQIDRKTINLWFVVLDPPTSPILDVYLERTPEQRVAVPMWERYAGPLYTDHSPMMGGGAILLLLGMGVLGIVLKRARRCPRCGLEMIANAEGPRGQSGKTCTACRDFFVGGKMNYQDKLTHESRLTRWESVGKWGFRLGNLVLPGLGSTSRGSAFGPAVFALAACGVALVLVGDSAYVDFWEPAVAATRERWFLGVGLVGLAALLSLVAVVFGDPADPRKTDVGGSSAEKKRKKKRTKKAKAPEDPLAPGGEFSLPPAEDYG